MLGNNLGLLASRIQAPKLLQTIATLATTDAIVVGTTINPYATDVPELLQYHERNRQRGLLGGQMRIRVRHRNLASDWWDYLMLAETELPLVLAGSDWQELEVLNEGSRLGVVLRRA